jgi:hypothetical protein
MWIPDLKLGFEYQVFIIVVAIALVNNRLSFRMNIITWHYGTWVARWMNIYNMAFVVYWSNPIPALNYYDKTTYKMVDKMKVAMMEDGSHVRALQSLYLELNLKAEKNFRQLGLIPFFPFQI